MSKTSSSATTQAACQTGVPSSAQTEEQFNATFALRYGFDLDKGDRMLVGRKFDLNAIPDKYRGQITIGDIVVYTSDWQVRDDATGFRFQIRLSGH